MQVTAEKFFPPFLSIVVGALLRQLVAATSSSVQCAIALQYRLLN